MFNNLLPGDWTTLAGVVIAFFGVLVSGLFSFLLYRATKQSTAAAQASAEAAKASTRIAENLEKRQLQRDAAFREQILIPIQDKASRLLTILNALVMESHKITNKLNDHDLVKLNVDPKYFAELPDNERILINNTWKNLDELLKNYWIESGGARHLKNVDTHEKYLNYRGAVDAMIGPLNDITRLK